MRILSNLLALLLLSCGYSAMSQIQSGPVVAINYTTSVTIASLKAAGAAVTNAKVCAVPADAYGKPITVTAPTWGIVLPSPPPCGMVSAGVLTGGLPVPDACHTNAAAPIFYNFTIQILNSAGSPTGAPFQLSKVSGVCGTTFALDSYTPTVTLAANPSNSLGYGSAIPSTCTAPSIWTNSTSPIAYTCYQGSYIPMLGPPNFTGNFVPGRTYASDDAVFYTDGSSYVSTINGNTSTPSPSSSTWVTLLSTVPPTSADAAIATLEAADGYTSPPSQLASTVGTTSPVAIASNNLSGVVIDAQSATTGSNILRSFSAKYSGAVAGRTVEFYLLAPNGSGGFAPFWASGLVAAPNAGVVTYTAANAQVIRVPAGTALGVWSSDGQGNSLYVAQSGGNSIWTTIWGYGQGRLSIGTAYSTSTSGFGAANNYIPSLSVSLAPDATLVATRWANQPYGWLRLNSAGGIDPSLLPASQPPTLPNLPTPYQATPPASLALGSTETLVYDPTTLTKKNVVYANPLTLQQSAFAGGALSSGGTMWYNTILCSYNTAGGVGFLQSGVLTRLKFWPTTNIGSSPALQAWIMRPSAAPTSSGVVTLTQVAALGSVSRVDTTSYVEFDGLAVPVLAGDLVCERGVNTDVAWGTAAQQYATDYIVQISKSDQSINALSAGGTTSSIASGYRIVWDADVQVSPYVLANSSAKLADVAGNLYPAIARPFDKPWSGLTCIAEGTSITAQNPVQGGSNQTLLTGSGYIPQAFRWSNCGPQSINNGIGSSGIVWDGTRQLSLSAKTSELVAAFGSGQGGASYQTRMTGLNADFVAFDEGYNDRGFAIGNLLYAAGDLNEDGSAATVGNLNVNRKNFYGAANYLRTAMLADRPSAVWLWITPISLFNPGTNAGTVDSYTNGWNNTNSIRTAIIALASYWNDPLLDWSRRFNLNWCGVQPSTVVGTSYYGVAPTYLGAYVPGNTYNINQQVTAPNGCQYISAVASNTTAPPTTFTGTTSWVMAGGTQDGVHPNQPTHDLAAVSLYRKMLEIAHF